MTQTDDPPPQVQPDEVAALIGGGEPSEPVQLKELDVTAAAQRKKTSRTRKAVPPQDKTFDKPVPDSDAVLTLDEKIQYVKCLAVRGTRFTLNVPPELPELAGIAIRIRCRQRSESAVIEEALKRDLERGLGSTPIAYRIQTYAAACQLLQYGDLKFAPFTKESAGEVTDAEIEELRRTARDMDSKLTEPEYFLALGSLQTFETKLYKCAEGVRNRDFLKAGG